MAGAADGLSCSTSFAVYANLPASHIDDGMKATPIQDPVVMACMRDIDLTLLRENLKLTPGQRLANFVRFASFASKLQKAGAESRRQRRRKKQ
jgi:hypothetical protein